MAQQDGLIVVDKPAGLTSHDVVSRMRCICGTRRVGHAGTLDPMATGVLVLGVNRGTRLLHFLIGADKAYTATIRLGVSTSTEDAEGEVEATVSTVDVDLSPTRIDRKIAELTGEIMQVPSSVSAIKVAGRRAYDLVRSGEDVSLPPRGVHIKRFTWSNARQVQLDSGQIATDIDAHIECSSGTYVRALARDLGNSLGTGAHLTALRRTRVGVYEISGAHRLEELEAGSAKIYSLGEAAAPLFPRRNLSAAEVKSLGYGQWIDRNEGDPAGTRDAPVAGFDANNNLIALLAVSDRSDKSDRSGSKYRPVVVFAPPAQ